MSTVTDRRQQVQGLTVVQGYSGGFVSTNVTIIMDQGVSIEPTETQLFQAAQEAAKAGWASREESRAAIDRWRSPNA